MKKQIRCKHTDVKFTEEIVAMHQIIFEGDSFYKNNEYGNRIKIYCECFSCGKRVAITHNNEGLLPKWIKRRIDMIKVKTEWWQTT